MILVILKCTIGSEKYLNKQLEKTDYYKELKESINSSLEDYLRPSGLPVEVINEIYTEDDLKIEVKKVINSLYHGKKNTINTTSVQENLNKNIEKYLEENNIQITDQEALDKFTSEVVRIYQKKILLTEKINNFTNTSSKVINILNISSLIVFFLIIVLGIIIRKVFQKTAFLKPLMATGILLLVANYILFQRIDIYHILFWNESISKIIQNIFFDLSELLKYSAISILIISLMIIILLALKNRKEK